MIVAGKATTDDELEEMLEGGNSAVFTAGVRLTVWICIYAQRQDTITQHLYKIMQLFIICTCIAIKKHCGNAFVRNMSQIQL